MNDPILRPGADAADYLPEAGGYLRISWDRARNPVTCDDAARLSSAIRAYEREGGDVLNDRFQDFYLREHLRFIKESVPGKCPLTDAELFQLYGATGVARILAHYEKGAKS